MKFITLAKRAFKTKIYTELTKLHHGFLQEETKITFSQLRYVHCLVSSIQNQDDSFGKEKLQQCFLCKRMLHEKDETASGTGGPVTAELDPATKKELKANGITTADESLRYLRREIRIQNRVSMHHIKQVHALLVSGSPINSRNAVLLILCCGSLMPQERPETRIRLLNDIWNTLERQKYNFIISHHNARLRAYIENDQMIDPIEYLNQLGKINMMPNNTTLIRLINACCQQGDIENALKILQMYQDNEHPLNELIFNSLVLGHARSGNMNAAYDVLKAMRDSDVSVSADTYATLASVQAEIGDIEGLRNTLEESACNDVPLSNSHLLNIIYCLATRGHHQHVSEIIDRLQKNSAIFNQNCKNAIYRLLNADCHDTALQLLRAMPLVVAGVPGGLGGQNWGLFYVRHMAKIGMPIGDIKSVCDDLHSLNPYLLHHALQAAIQYHVPLVYPIMDAIAAINNKQRATSDRDKEDFGALRPHYFWPLFCQNNSDSTEDILFVLRLMMSQYGVPITLTTLAQYAIPALLKCMHARAMDAVLEVIQHFRQLAIPDTLIHNAIMMHFLLQRNLQQAAAVNLLFCKGDEKSSSFLSPSLLPVLSSAVVAGADLRALPTLLVAMATARTVDTAVSQNAVPDDNLIDLQNLCLTCSEIPGVTDTDVVTTFLLEVHCRTLTSQTANNTLLPELISLLARAQVLPTERGKELLVQHLPNELLPDLRTLFRHLEADGKYVGWEKRFIDDDQKSHVYPEERLVDAITVKLWPNEKMVNVQRRSPIGDAVASVFKKR